MRAPIVLLVCVFALASSGCSAKRSGGRASASRITSTVDRSATRRPMVEQRQPGRDVGRASKKPGDARSDSVRKEQQSARLATTADERSTPPLNTPSAAVADRGGEIPSESAGQQKVPGEHADTTLPSSTITTTTSQSRASPGRVTRAILATLLVAGALLVLKWFVQQRSAQS
jgi:hypothetical protein